jgi:hypothetical protein
MIGSSADVTELISVADDPEVVADIYRPLFM